MALLVVFLVLAAQFESFINPLVILVTVPLAMTGALIGLLLYGSSVNVFSQIGAILLIGLSAKNGVLIVEFANQLRDRGLEIHEAVLEAATVRLRPILMTSAATTFGALPLLLGQRRRMGIAPADRHRDRVRGDGFSSADPVHRAFVVCSVRAEDLFAATGFTPHRAVAAERSIWKMLRRAKEPGGL